MRHVANLKNTRPNACRLGAWCADQLAALLGTTASCARRLKLDRGARYDCAGSLVGAIVHPQRAQSA